MSEIGVELERKNRKRNCKKMTQQIVGGQLSRI